jgi:oligosaccharide amylase
MVGIIGNGKFLAKLDDMGSIEYVFYPHLGFEKHILDSAFAILCDGELKWHWDYSWNVCQNYLKDTNILKTTYKDKNFLVSSADYISISHDIIVKDISITNSTEEKKHLKLFFYENLRIGEYPKKNTVKFLKNDNCIIKYDDKYVFCIGSDKEVHSYQCGVRSSESSAYKDIENGILKEHSIAEGMITDSALCWDIQLNPFQGVSIPIYILISKYDNNYYNIMDLIDTFKIVSKNKNDIYELTQTYWINIMHDVNNNLNTSIYVSKNKDEIWKKYIDTCKRSILTILLLSNYDGGIIASPSLYPDYRYVWNRDASYISVALDLCGLSYLSEKYFEWCRNTQNSDGSWFQNYYVNGKPRLTAMQNDQVGTTIWAVLVHYRITHNKRFLKRCWDMVKKAGNYLADVATNLAPSYDLWEEKYGTFSYTIGAIYGGLKSAYTIGKILEEEWGCNFTDDDKELIEKWNRALEFLKSNVDKFYSKDKNRFVKSINPLDKSIDASILGLSFPYGLIPADDPRMIKTAEQIENAFNYKIGGIGRYPEDVYFGGNPWIITTLWLYLYYRRLIKVLSDKKVSDKTIDKYDKKCNELIKWALKHQFNGLFPEQVHKDLGAPMSAIPLGWSHAMVIIAIRDNINVLIP